MNAILVLLKKDFALFFRDRAALVLAFVIPFALIFLFGQIFRVNAPDPGPSGIRIAVVNQSDNPAATQLIGALKAEKAFQVVTTFNNPDKSTRPLAEDDLRALMHADAFRFALVIPKDVVRTDRIGIHLKTYTNPRNETEAQTVNGILEKDLFSNVPQLLGQSLEARARDIVGDARLRRFDSSIANAVADAFGGDADRIRERMEDGAFGFHHLDSAASSGGSGSSDVFSRIVAIDSVQVAGTDVKSPEATLLVGGWAMQFLLFAVTASANALFREKEQGIFQRVLSAPASKGDILWSKFLYGVCLGLLQLVVLFTAGHVLYGIDIGPYMGRLVAVCVFAAAACTSFGMLIAAVSSSPESARGLSTFVILLMCAIGGAWFPVSFMPEFIQRFSKLTLVYWSMEGFNQVLWAHDTLGQIVPTLGYLTLITIVVLGIALWRFRRGRIFE